ncbi:MAG: efflux RND transporter permease subunit [Myxococcales bacterium]
MSEARHDVVCRLTRSGIQHPWLTLFGAAVVAAASIVLASGLEIRSSFEELLPSNLPSVALVKQLIKRVGGDGTVFVQVEAKDAAGLAAAEAIAPKLAQDFVAMGPDKIRAVESNVAPVRDWYAKRWPLFVPLDDLTKARDSLQEEIKRRKIEANPLAVQLDDDEEDAKPAAKPAQSSGPVAEWLDPKKPLPREQVLQRFARYKDGFFVYPEDQKSLTIVVRPTGTSLGVADARKLLDEMQVLVDKHKAELTASGLRVGFAGSFPMFVAEYEAIIHDVRDTALLCITVVLLSILLFFRDVRSTVTLGIAVLTAVAITFGLTRLTIGYLNTQTAFLGAIVVGTGINYGLIYLARVQQLRRQGNDLLVSCVEGARTTAEATLLASAATSVSFGVLIIAANRGFRHFGFIGGLGMLLCWVATFLLVPSLLAIYEKLRGAPRRAVDPEEEGRHLLPHLRRFFGRPGLIAAIFAVLAVISAVLFLRQLPNAMERNLENLSNELKGQETLLRDQSRAGTSLGQSTAGVVALLDSWDEADEFCGQIRKRIDDPRWSKLIESCTTLSSVVPRQQPEKLAVLRQIAAEVPDSVIARLDPALRSRVREVRGQLAEQTQVDVKDAPQGLIDKFRERDGSVGRIASVTARGDAKLELGPNLEAFVRGVRDVPVGNKKVDATGENVIFADLLTDIESEGPRTTVFSFLGVCLLVFLFFRHLRTSLEILGSLFIGVVLMGGVAAAVGLKINFFNFIVFPITFGIAVDYGANVAARVRERRGDVLLSLAEVGPAVALCSWTSIVGYGSLLFSLNRALRSFGWYAMAGEVTTIVTAIVLLPALLLLARRRAHATAPLEERPRAATSIDERPPSQP